MGADVEKDDLFLRDHNGQGYSLRVKWAVHTREYMP